MKKKHTIIIMFILLLLIGCGKSGDNPFSGGGPAPIGDGVHFWILTGTFSGGSAGKYYIAAYSGKCFTPADFTNNYVAGTNTPNGTFVFKVPTACTQFFINTFRDTNGNGSFDAGEPSGWYMATNVYSLKPDTATTFNPVSTTTQNINTVRVPIYQTIQGTIGGGTGGGTYYISAYYNKPVTTQDYTTFWVAQDIQTTSGNAYSISVPDKYTTYYINAYRDTNGNGVYDNGEPSVWYNNVGPAGSATGVSQPATNINLAMPNNKALTVTLLNVTPIADPSKYCKVTAYYNQPILLADYTTFWAAEAQGNTTTLVIQVPGTYSTVYVQSLLNIDGINGYSSTDRTKWYGAVPPGATAVNISSPTSISIDLGVTVNMGGEMPGPPINSTKWWVIIKNAQTNVVTVTDLGNATDAVPYVVKLPMNLTIPTYYIQFVKDMNNDGAYTADNYYTPIYSLTISQSGLDSGIEAISNQFCTLGPGTPTLN